MKHYILWLILFLSSCDLIKMLPSKTVLTNKKRNKLEAENKTTDNTNYSKLLKTEVPIIPFQIFGVTYAKDIVIVTKHPKWNMHEYAKLEIAPNKYTWLMKDSEERSMDQFLTTNQANLVQLLPEIPLQTNIQNFHFNEKCSQGDSLEVHFEYINALNEKVIVDFENTKTLLPLKKRNGSSMGHSKNQVAVILDLPLRQFADYSKISYNGEHYKTKKILGLQKFHMLLEQTQGGFSIGNFEMGKQGNRLISIHKPSEIEQLWTIDSTQNNLLALSQKNSLRTQSYYYKKENDKFFLEKTSVTPWNATVPAFEVSLFPPLPDLRYYFEGKKTSQFTLDINGQKNHGKGTMTVYWSSANELILELLPTAPWWLKERPMQTNIRFESKNKITVSSKMLPYKNR